MVAFDQQLWVATQAARHHIWVQQQRDLWAEFNAAFAGSSAQVKHAVRQVYGDALFVENISVASDEWKDGILQT